MNYDVYMFFCEEKVFGLLTSHCNTMQFQKRDYAKVELFRCGKKGHGLQAKERIPRGTFVIEYVGEVCPFSTQVLYFFCIMCCRTLVGVFVNCVGYKLIVDQLSLCCVRIFHSFYLRLRTSLVSCHGDTVSFLSTSVEVLDRCNYTC